MHLGQVSFTGSTEVGALVGAAAAKNIKPCTLELGGKSAAIVWKDVDIDQVHVSLRYALLTWLTVCPVTQSVLHDLIAQAAGVGLRCRWCRRHTTRCSSTTASAAQPVRLWHCWVLLERVTMPHYACFGIFDETTHCEVPAGQI